MKQVLVMLSQTEYLQEGWPHKTPPNLWNLTHQELQRLVAGWAADPDVPGCTLVSYCLLCTGESCLNQTLLRNTESFSLGIVLQRVLFKP